MKKIEKNDEIWVKYPKILVDGYIFSNFISGSIDIEYIEDIWVIYPNILNFINNMFTLVILVDINNLFMLMTLSLLVTMRVSYRSSS